MAAFRNLALATKMRFLASLAAASAVSAAPLKVLPLGDSITFGCGDGCEGMGCGYECAFWRSSCQAGWRTGLWRRLSPSGPTSPHWDFVGTNQNGPDDIDKDHEGYPGWTMEHVQIISDDWAALEPDVILLHLGTNNLGSGYNQTAAMAVHSMGALLQTMFTKLPDVHLLLSTLIGTHDYYGGGRHKEYNVGLRELAASYRKTGYDVDLVDMDAESGIGERCDSENCCDGPLMEDIHPNQQGYDRMADVWHKHLTTRYNSTQASPRRDRRTASPRSLRRHSHSADGNETASDRFAAAVHQSVKEPEESSRSQQRDSQERPRFLH